MTDNGKPHLSTARVSARVLSIFRGFGDRQTTSRPAGRKAVSRLGEGEAKKNKNYQQLKTLAESCHCGYQTDCSRPNRIRVCGRRGQRGKEKQSQRETGQATNAMQSMPMQSKHGTMSWMDGPGSPTPFPNCHPSSGRPRTQLYHSTRAAGAASMVCTLMVLKQDEDPQALPITQTPRGESGTSTLLHKASDPTFRGNMSCCPG